MMLGKQISGRPSPASRRHHMRRTTSMTEFAAPEDVLADVAEEEDEAELQLLPAHVEAAAEPEVADPYGWAIIGGAASASASAAGRADWLPSYRARAAPALAGRLRRNSAAETAAFLRACGLCNRRLGPGRDTFMYRGDTAFCSLECRQQHITIEEWKDKCALATPPPASDPVVPLPPPRPSGAGSDKPAGTVATAS